MKHFVALDVSMKETAVCVVDDAGQRIWEGSVPSTADFGGRILKAGDRLTRSAPRLSLFFLRQGTRWRPLNSMTDDPKSITRIQESGHGAQEIAISMPQVSRPA